MAALAADLIRSLALHAVGRGRASSWLLGEFLDSARSRVSLKKLPPKCLDLRLNLFGLQHALLSISIADMSKILTASKEKLNFQAVIKSAAIAQPPQWLGERPTPAVRMPGRRPGAPQAVGEAALAADLITV